MNTTKLYEHDCDNCVYVFTTHGDVCYDWYVCPRPGEYDTSVIARYGDKGWAYWSCPAYMVRDHKYGVASHQGSDRTSISQMSLMANMVLDYYEKEMK